MINTSKFVKVGTSGWHYDHWTKVFYPPKLSKNKWLDFYQSRFDTVEINNTFYVLPKEKTVVNWVSKVRDDFLFSVKINKQISHLSRLNPSEEQVIQFFKLMKIFGKKLGPILIQTPPNLKLDIMRLKLFCEKLPKENLYAFEFRDDSWFSDFTYDILQEIKATVCITKKKQMIELKNKNFSFYYIRFHGTDEKVQGRYSLYQLKKWGNYIKTLEEQGKQIFCYFNNDAFGYAVKNALDLLSFLQI